MRSLWFEGYLRRNGSDETLRAAAFLAFVDVMGESRLFFLSARETHRATASETQWNFVERCWRG